MTTRVEFKHAYEPTIRAIERGRLSPAERQRALARLKSLRDALPDGWDRRSADADVAAVERAMTALPMAVRAPVSAGRRRANRLLSRALAAVGPVEDRLGAAMGAQAELRFILEMAPVDEQPGIARMMLPLADHMRRLTWEQRTSRPHA